MKLSVVKALFIVFVICIEICSTQAKLKSLRSDVLPVSAGSAAASMALLQKQLRGLGIPDWEELKEISRRVRVFGRVQEFDVS